MWSFIDPSESYLTKNTDEFVFDSKTGLGRMEIISTEKTARKENRGGDERDRIFHVRVTGKDLKPKCGSGSLRSPSGAHSRGTRGLEGSEALSWWEFLLRGHGDQS